MRDADARAFLEVHHDAVRGLAARDYDAAVIDRWAPLPITDEMVERVIQNADGETRFVAEQRGSVVGIGCLVSANRELRACYVSPAVARCGVGSGLVEAIETRAIADGVTLLQAHSSLTAEPFYRALGYQVQGYGTHWLKPGIGMPCVEVSKELSRD